VERQAGNISLSTCTGEEKDHSSYCRCEGGGNGSISLCRKKVEKPGAVSDVSTSRSVIQERIDEVAFLQGKRTKRTHATRRSEGPSPDGTVVNSNRRKKEGTLELDKNCCSGGAE